MRLDLTKGITQTEQYKAWKFPGGEIHVQLGIEVRSSREIEIFTRLNTSDDIMFLLIVTDTIHKDSKGVKLSLTLPYMPYQQADRNFGEWECFSLKTMANLINSMNFDKIKIYDPHSEVSPALLNNCEVKDNSDFVTECIKRICSYIRSVENPFPFCEISDSFIRENLVVLSTDAGSYKKAFHLVEKLHLNCAVECCSKSRNHNTGEITTKVPKFDENKLVLIIDDICLAGNTFLNIRKELKNKNVFLAVSHGIFNENVDKLETEFTKVYTTNSRRDESVGKNIEVIKIF
jgi:ribose-phosphate pyrophosphokinase